jgi:hypothetical protein
LKAEDLLSIPQNPENITSYCGRERRQMHKGRWLKMRMKKKSAFIILLFSLFVISINKSNANIIYDEENQLLYIGGYPIENLRMAIDKNDKFELLNKIFQVDLKKNELKEIFKTDHDITSYKLSKNGIIAIGSLKLNAEGSIIEEKLNIINKEGVVIKKINNVINRIRYGYFSWSPDGDKIVYVTGKSMTERRYPFEPQGVFIYDINKDTILKISEKGTDVKWAKHDKKIYIQNNFIEDSAADVSVYDPNENKLVKSDKKGIIFTDDGKYYIAKKVDGFDEEAVTEYSIYDNASNKPIYHFNEDEKYLLVESYGNYWFIKSTHNLLIAGSMKYIVFDVDKKKIIANRNKSLIGFNADMTKGIVYEGGGKFVHIVFLMEGIKTKSVGIPQ